MQTPEDILRFWFSPRAEKHWFESTDAFDADIRREFESTAMRVMAALSSPREAHVWEAESTEAHLALIIVLDQFPRNMYRATPAAFAWDAYALAAAKRMVERKSDVLLSQKQRSFAYMPFMHSEALDDQKECVRLCDARLDDGNTLRFAEIHRDVIARFGRFPHRNEVLGRESSREEIAFLENGGFSA